MTAYILLAVSVLSMIVHSVLLNAESKGSLKTKGDTYFFNTVQYIASFIVFAVLAIGKPVSLFTVLMGALFGIITVFANANKMFALAIGPMHITLLIYTASMIIPALSGIFYGERLSVFKTVAILLLIFFLYLTMGKSEGGERANKKWIIFCILGFIASGAIGVMQKIHQESVHRDETAAFLAVAFLFSVIYSVVMCAKEKQRGFKFRAKHYSFAVICGICVYLMNHINLILSGQLPTQLFFPLVNGSTLLICSLLSVFLFRETLSRRQLIGLIGGFISLILICFL